MPGQVRFSRRPFPLPRYRIECCLIHRERAHLLKGSFMSEISASELEKKLYIEVDGQPYFVLDVKFATPSARGASTMVKTKVRNLLNGAVLDKTFKTSEKFEVPDVEKVPAVFQYITGSDYHFMDNVAYEEFTLTAEKLGEQKLYLKENQEVLALKLRGA